MRRINLLLVFALVASLLTALPASAQEEETPYPLVFPLVGENYYSDTWGAARSGGRTHAGTDIMAEKMIPVVAVADGTVGGDYGPDGAGGWFHGDGDCCAMTLEHDDGWSSWYIHLNNDTPGTDDGLGWGFAEGIEPGVHVEAGQLIGYVGDSGNAEWTASHLHFELHDTAGEAINPYIHLLAAQVITEPGAVEPPPPLGWDHPDGFFVDDNNSVHEDDINVMASLGITKGCNPPTNDQYCPTGVLSRGEVAAFLRRYLDLPDTDVDYYDDDDGTLFEGDINALTDVGIGFGCEERAFCSGADLPRNEMAELLVRSFGYTNPEGVDFFVDDDGVEYEASINALAHVGVTLGCNPPTNDRFCPGTTLSRGQMASFIVRAINLQEAASQ